MLFQEYKSKFWYWEVVDSIRRVALTGLLVLFEKETRAGVAVCLAVGFQRLYDRAEPFVQPRSNTLCSISNFQISMGFVLLLYSQANPSSVGWQHAVGLGVIITNCMLLPMLIVFQVHRAQRRHKVMSTLGAYNSIEAGHNNDGFLHSKSATARRQSYMVADGSLTQQPMPPATTNGATILQLMPQLNKADFIEICESGRKNRALLVRQVFNWLSEWTFEFPITNEKWTQLQFVLDLLNEDDGKVSLGISFACEGAVCYARAVEHTKRSEIVRPNSTRNAASVAVDAKQPSATSTHMICYTSCERPDEPAIIDKEKQIVQLERSFEPVPYKVRTAGLWLGANKSVVANMRECHPARASLRRCTGELVDRSSDFGVGKRSKYHCENAPAAG